MIINTLDRPAPAKPGILASLLLATALNIPLGQTQAFPSESVDPSIHLPPNQAVEDISRHAYCQQQMSSCHYRGEPDTYKYARHYWVANILIKRI